LKFIMANFGDSFLDMAEAMLGKFNTSSSFDISKVPPGRKRKASSGLKRFDASDTYSTSGYLNTQKDQQNKDDGVRSSVVVTPPKRRRIAVGKNSAVETVLGLNRSISKSERLESLGNALDAFDHDDQELHDTEIEVGADIALVKNLILLEFRTSFRREPMKCDIEVVTREIGLILKCLEHIYRASSDSVGKSFNRVGNDLLQILIFLIDEEIKSRLKSSAPLINEHETKDKTNNKHIERNGNILNKRNNETNNTRDVMIRTATKIFGHFARVGKATRPMALFPRFLETILHLCKVHPYNMVPFEARLSCLWTIANLACNADNMATMMDIPKLIDSLILLCNRRPDSGKMVESVMEILRTKSIISRTFLNLSWSPENKVSMSKNSALVQTLCQLAQERQAPYRNSKTMQNVMLQTRRHSLASLRNISATPKHSKLILCDGNQGKLLDTLTDVILNEKDHTVVEFSFSAIRNLAIHETAELIVDRPALVLALNNAMLESNSDSCEVEMHSIKYQCASVTLSLLEEAITPDKISYESFRELLDTINPSNSTECNNESTYLHTTPV